LHLVALPFGDFCLFSLHKPAPKQRPSGDIP
jgi:hypothetical protein